MRLRLDLAYDGSGFHGWAAQPGLRTVQGDLERALDTVLRSTDSALTVAGRTDAGVHARGQVAQVDVDPALVTAACGSDGPARLVRRVNGVLEPDVRVLSVTIAPPGFDARFSAVWRRYVYRISDRPDTVDPLVRGHVLTWARALDDLAMNRAASALVGGHDFAAFCRKRVGATTVRTLLELHWQRDARGLLLGTIRADAFCHNMVRGLVGCLLSVGEGRRPVEWPHHVLLAGRRDPAVTVAAAHGLTLEEVGYPPDDELAARAEQARAVRNPLSVD